VRRQVGGAAVGLDLDEPAGEAAIADISDENLAQQVAGDLEGRAREELGLEQPPA
jgi:hypothetical protein